MKYYLSAQINFIKNYIDIILMKEIREKKKEQPHLEYYTYHCRRNN